MVETQSALKQVVCPSCGLVNLEKFITFPHCAGCGTLLSAAAAHAPRSFWNQPLRAGLWVTVIALCCLALSVLGVNIARETSISAERPLIIYAQRTNSMKVGEPAIVQFMLDTMANTPETNVSHFTKVEIRTPSTMSNTFELLDVSPHPDHTGVSVGGDTIEWDDLPREQPIRLRLRPRRAGSFRMVISLFAVDFTPVQYRASVEVFPSQSASSHAVSHSTARVSPRAAGAKVTK